MAEREMVDWDCPACESTNTDHQDQYTHCACCGEVVYVLDQDNLVHDQHWKVLVVDPQC